MEQRLIGDLEVSVIGLGCNNFGMRIDEVQTRHVVSAALSAGINFFDTADIYGGTRSEEYLGRALGQRRQEVVLATKFGMEVDPQRHGAAPDYVHQACEDSLRRLGTDYIDLYWLHRPDPATPIADTLGALTELISAGKVRCIGCSNFSPLQLRQAQAEAARLGTAVFVALQNELSLIQREALAPENSSAASGRAHEAGGAGTSSTEPNPRCGTLAACRELGLAFVPYFPLASGLLSGKYRLGEPAPEGTRLSTSPRGAQYLTEERLGLVERLIEWSARQGHSLLELAHAWLLAHEGVASVISGATQPEQVQANALAGDWSLTPEQMAEVEALL